MKTAFLTAALMIIWACLVFTLTGAKTTHTGECVAIATLTASYLGLLRIARPRVQAFRPHLLPVLYATSFAFFAADFWIIVYLLRK